MKEKELVTSLRSWRCAALHLTGEFSCLHVRCGTTAVRICKTEESNSRITCNRSLCVIYKQNNKKCLDLSLFWDGVFYYENDVVVNLNWLITQLLCVNSGSASFRGAFEGRLRHYATRRLSQSKGSSRCSFFSLFLRSFVASHIPRFLACPKKKKEREKMATSSGVDRHFRGPGHRKEWRKGKTSGDATRKCSKG